MRKTASVIDGLSRLWRDERGNAAMIMAAALFPILGLIGSGLDLTRAYLVKSKMQVACDSSSLGARRAMASSTLDATAIAEGERFFNFNFPAGTMQSAPVKLAIKPNATDVSTVDVTAATSVPTSIMALFGIDRLPIEVACSADQDYVNNDIMLVLDVTGSMNCTAGTNCEYAATEQNASRLARVKSAAASLYRVLKDARGVRTRYGFMPYSMSVNVGADLNTDWIRDPGHYWQEKSKKWVLSPVRHSALWRTTSWAGCVEERSTISRGTGSKIEISADVAQADIDQVGAAGAATDHLKWAPYDEAATEGESGYYANLTSFCPARATKLATYDTEKKFQDRVDASMSRVGGYTNHDLGILWGMRYLSTTGMFAADNLAVVNQVPVGKHIIFLTDGKMTAYDRNYSAFGIPLREDRMIGNGNLEQRHKDRFLNACNRARQMGATIWVIAIDEGSTGDISPCASGSDHFFFSDGSDLDQVFQRIGKGIGRLRLTI